MVYGRLVMLFGKSEANTTPQTMLAFDYDETHTFFCDQQQTRHFIKIIRIFDVNAVLSLNSNSYQFALAQFKTIIHQFSNLKIIKLLNKPQLQIDIEHTYQLIDKINESFYSSTYLKTADHQTLLAHKLQLLSLIKTKYDENIDWIAKEKSVFLVFEETDVTHLEQHLQILVDFFRKVQIEFMILNPQQGFDTIKAILHKDDSINSRVLAFDSRINKASLFNIETLDATKHHLIINTDKLLKLSEVRFEPNGQIEALFYLLKTIELDVILEFNKHDASTFNTITLTLANWATDLKTLEQQQRQIRQIITNQGFQLNDLKQQQFARFTNLIVNQRLPKKSLRPNLELFERIINFGFLSANTINETPAALIGFNDHNELTYINRNYSLISIGAAPTLFAKLVNEKIIQLERIVLYDYHNVFYPLNQYYNNSPITLKQLALNPFVLVESPSNAPQEQYASQIQVIMNLFRIVDPTLDSNDLTTLKQTLQTHYQRQAAAQAGTPSKKRRLKLDFEWLATKLQTDHTTTAQKLLAVCHFINNDPLLQILVNAPGSLELPERKLISFDLSFLEHQNPIVQRVVLYLLNHMVAQLLQTDPQPSSIYLSNLKHVITNPLLFSQLQHLEQTKVALYGYLEKTDVDLANPMLITWLKQLPYLNLVPQQDYSQQFWKSLLNQLELTHDERDDQRLNTINDKHYLLINQRRRYWYQNRCLDFELKAWKNQILNRHLSQYEINKVLRSQIDALETAIYYLRKKQDDHLQNFLIRNSLVDEVQRKIYTENQKYIKKLL